MLPTSTLLSLAACFATFGQVVLADPEMVIAHHIVVRQEKDEESKTTDAPKETESTDSKDEDKSSADDKDSSSGSSADKTGADLNTAKPTETGKDKDDDKKGSKTTSSAPKKTKFAADAPAGGVDMVSPSALGGSTELYKIGDTVTWSWNYTSLQGTPTAVDVLVSNSRAAATWTLTANMSFESSVEFEWKTEKQQQDVQQPLLTDLYTLIVKDSAAKISDTPEPGYLGVSSNFVFGLYKKQPYVDLDKWECTGCNAGAGGFDKQAVGMAMTMSVLTVLSFTWFVAGLALP